MSAGWLHDIEKPVHFPASYSSVTDDLVHLADVSRQSQGPAQIEIPNAITNIARHLQLFAL